MGHPLSIARLASLLLILSRIPPGLPSGFLSSDYLNDVVSPSPDPLSNECARFRRFLGTGTEATYAGPFAASTFATSSHASLPSASGFPLLNSSHPDATVEFHMRLFSAPSGANVERESGFNASGGGDRPYGHWGTLDDDSRMTVVRIGTAEGDQATMLKVMYRFSADELIVEVGNADVVAAIPGVGIREKSGSWVHVAVSVELTYPSTVRFLAYIDGALEADTTVVGSAIPEASAGADGWIAIGFDTGPSGRTIISHLGNNRDSVLKGDIDDLRLWAGVRTLAGIQYGLNGDLSRGGSDRASDPVRPVAGGPPPSPCIVRGDPAVHGTHELVARFLFDECPQGPVRAGGPLYDPFAGMQRGIEACAAGVPVVHAGSPVARVERFVVANEDTRDALNVVATVTLSDALLHIRDGVLDPECGALSFVLVDVDDPACEAYGPVGAAGRGADPGKCELVRLSHAVDASSGGCAWMRPATGPVAAHVRVPFLAGRSSATILAVIGPVGMPNGYDVFNIGYASFEHPDDILHGSEILLGGPSARASDPDAPGAGFTGLAAIGLGSLSAGPSSTFQRRNLAVGAGASMHWTVMVWDANVTAAVTPVTWYWGVEGHPTRSVAGSIPGAIGFNSAISEDMYSAYFHGLGWYATPVPRSRGWHKLEYVVESMEGAAGRFVTARIDGVAIVEDHAIGAGQSAEDARLDTSFFSSHPNEPVVFDDFAAWVTPRPGTIVVRSRCGNGVVDFEEQCDDGNLDPHDGCSPGCRVEEPWRCVHPPPGSPGPSVCTNPPPNCGRALQLAYSRDPSARGVRARVSWDEASSGAWVWCFRDSQDPTPSDPGAAWMRVAQYPARPVDVASGAREGSPDAADLSTEDYARLADAEVGDAAPSSGPGLNSSRIWRFKLADPSESGASPYYFRSPHSMGLDSLRFDFGFINRVQAEVCALGTPTFESCQAGGGFTTIFNLTARFGAGAEVAWPDRLWLTGVNDATCARMFANHGVGSLHPNIGCYTTAEVGKRCFSGGDNCAPNGQGLDGSLTPDVWVDGNSTGFAGAACAGTQANNRRFEASCSCVSTNCVGATGTTDAATAAGAGCGCGWDQCDAQDCGDGHCDSWAGNFTSCTATPCDGGGVSCVGSNCQCTSVGPYGNAHGRRYNMRAVEIAVLDPNPSCGDGVVQRWEQCDGGGKDTLVQDSCSPITCMFVGPRLAYRDTVGMVNCKELAQLRRGPDGERHYGDGTWVRAFGHLADVWPRATRRVHGPLAHIVSPPRYAAVCIFEKIGGVSTPDAAFTVVASLTGDYVPTGEDVGDPSQGFNGNVMHRLSDEKVAAANGHWRGGAGADRYVLSVEAQVVHPSSQTVRHYHRVAAPYNDTSVGFGVAFDATPGAQTVAKGASFEVARPLMAAPLYSGPWWDTYFADGGGVDYRLFADHQVLPGPGVNYTFTCNYGMPNEIRNRRCISRYSSTSVWETVPHATIAVMEDECGDGVVGPREACDDGNIIPRDGCTSCSIDNAWVTCVGEPSVCFHGLSCAGIHAAHPDWPSGHYRIGFNVTASPVDGRPVPANVEEVPCDMETDGGGWTRVSTLRGDDHIPLAPDGYPSAKAARNMIYNVGARSAHLPNTVVNAILQSASLDSVGRRPSLFRFNASSMLNTLYATYDAVGCDPWDAGLSEFALSALGSSARSCPSRMCRARRLDRGICPSKIEDWTLITNVAGSTAFDTYLIRTWDTTVFAPTNDGNRMFMGISRPCYTSSDATVRCVSSGFGHMNHGPHATALFSVRPVVVGDGFADILMGEECDDGNMVGGDGCDAFGRREPSTLHHTCDDVAAAGGASGVYPLRVTAANGSAVDVDTYCDIPTPSLSAAWRRPRALLALFSQAGALDSSGDLAVNETLSASGLRGPGRPWTEGTLSETPLRPPWEHDPTVTRVTAQSHDWRSFLPPEGATLVQECRKDPGGSNYIAFAFDVAPGPRRSRGRNPVDSLAQHAMGHPGMRLAAHTLPLASARLVDASGWGGAVPSDNTTGTMEWLARPQGGLRASSVRGLGGDTWRDWSAGAPGAPEDPATGYAAQHPARLWLPPTHDYVEASTATPAARADFGSGFVATGHAARGSIAFRKVSRADTGSAGVVAGGVGFPFLPSWAAGDDPDLRDPLAGVGGDPEAGGGPDAATAAPTTPAGSDLAHLPGRRDVYGLSGDAMTCAYWIYPAIPSELPGSCAELATNPSAYTARLRTRAGAVPSAGPLVRGGRPGSGTYLISPGGPSRASMIVFCDMETDLPGTEARGGWALLSRFSVHEGHAFIAGHPQSQQFAARNFDHDLHESEWKWRRGPWTHGPSVDRAAWGLQGSLRTASWGVGEREAPYGREGISDEFTALDPRYDDAGPSAGFKGRGVSSVDWRAFLASAERTSIYRIRQRCEVNSDPRNSSLVADISFEVAWGDAPRIRTEQHMADPTVHGRQDWAAWKLASPVVHEWSLPGAPVVDPRARLAFAPPLGSTRGSLYSSLTATLLTGTCSSGRAAGVGACDTDHPQNSRAGHAGIVFETAASNHSGFSAMPRGSMAPAESYGSAAAVYPDSDDTQVCTYWMRKIQRAPVSCVDILRNRGDSTAAPSGVYWILSRDAPELAARRAIRVFCDMDTYHGGFALMASFATPSGGMFPNLPQEQFDRQFHHGGWIWGRGVDTPDSAVPDYGTGAVKVSSYNIFSLLDTFRDSPGEYEVRQQCYRGADPSAPIATTKMVDVSHLFTYAATKTTDWMSRFGMQNNFGPTFNAIPLRAFSVISNYGATFHSSDEGNALWFMPSGILSSGQVFHPCGSGGTSDVATGSCTKYSNRRTGASGIITNPGTSGTDLGFGACPLTATLTEDTAWLHQDSSTWGKQLTSPTQCSYYLRENHGQLDASGLTVSSLYAGGGDAPLFVWGGSSGEAGLAYPGATTNVSVDSAPCSPLTHSDARSISCLVSPSFAVGAAINVQVTLTPGPRPGAGFGSRGTAVAVLVASVEDVSVLPGGDTALSTVHCNATLGAGAVGPCPTLRGWLSFESGNLAGPPLPHEARIVQVVPLGPGPHLSVNFSITVLDPAREDGAGSLLSPTASQCIACEGCIMCPACTGCPIVLPAENATLGVVGGSTGTPWDGSGRGSLRASLLAPEPPREWISRAGAGPHVVVSEYNVSVDVGVTFPKFPGASYGDPGDRVQLAVDGPRSEVVTVVASKEFWPDPTITAIVPAAPSCSAAGSRTWSPSSSQFTLFGARWEPSVATAAPGSLAEQGLSNATEVRISGLPCVAVRMIGSAVSLSGDGNAVVCEGLPSSIFPRGRTGGPPASVEADAGAPGSTVAAPASAWITIPGRIDVDIVSPASGSLGRPGSMLLSPAGPSPPTTGTIVVNGTGFSGATSVVLGSLGPCDVIRIVSDAVIECDVTLPITAVGAPAPVVVVHPSRCMAPASATSFGVPAPTISAVTPATLSFGAPGVSLQVTLAGSGFPSPASLALGLNVTFELSVPGGPVSASSMPCTSADVISTSEVVCTLEAPDFANGTASATVVSAVLAMGPSWTLLSAVSVVPPAPQVLFVREIPTQVSLPTVSSVSPTEGPALGGTTITVNGTGFATLGSITVAVGGFGCAVVSVSPALDSLVCTTGSSSGPYDVPQAVVIGIVGTGVGSPTTLFSVPSTAASNGLPASDAFTYVSDVPAAPSPSPLPSVPPAPTPGLLAPTITNVWPPLVPVEGGVDITISGSFPDPMGVTVQVDGRPCAPVKSSTSTVIVCSVPERGPSGERADVQATGVSDAQKSTITDATAVGYVKISDALEWVQADGMDPAVTGEDGTRVTYTIRSTISLFAEVTVDIRCDDDTEVEAIPSSITLSEDVGERSFALVGQPDDLRDGNATFSCALFTISSSTVLDGSYLQVIRGVNMDSSPEIVAVRPTIIPMAGNVRVTVFGRRFDRNVTVWAGITQISLNGTFATVEAPGFDPRRRWSRGGTADAKNAQDGRGLGVLASRPTLDPSDITGLDFPAGATHAVVYESPVLDVQGYQDVLVRNDDTRSGTGVGASLLYMSEDCPFPGQLGTRTDCRDCPEGGICPGGNRIWPKDGYWNPGEGSGFVIKCDPPEACSGCDNAETAGDCYASLPPCSLGYEGDYCSECTRNPPHVRTRERCVPCPPAESQVLSIVLFVVLWLVVSLTGCLLQHREDFSHLAQVIIAVQEIYGVGSMVRFALPEWVAAVYDVLVLFSGDITFAKMDCTGAFDPSMDFFLAIAFNVAIGVPMHLLVRIIGLVAVHRARSRGGDEAAEERRAHYAARGTRLLSAHCFLVYLAVTSRCIGIMTCLKTGDEMRLAVQRSHVCYRGAHVAATALASFILIFFTAGFPAYIFFRVMRGREDAVLYGEPSYYEAHDFMYEPFTLRDRYGWFCEFAVSITIAIASTVLVKHPLIQLILTGSVFLLFALGIVVRRPFIRAYENVVFFALQISNVIAAAIVYVSNVGIVEGSALDAMVYVLVALAGGVLTTFICVALYAIFKGDHRDSGAAWKGKGDAHDADAIVAAAEMEYEYCYEDGDVGAGAVEFDVAEPATWLSLFTGGDGEAGDAAARARKKVRRAVFASAAVTAGNLAGRTEREGGPAIPAEVPRNTSTAVSARRFEEPSALASLLAAIGLAEGTAPQIPSWWSKTSSSTGFLLKPATAEQVRSAQELLSATAIDFSGGADNPGLTHTGVQVCSVEFVENPRLFAAYASEVAQVRRTHADEKRAAPALSLATAKPSAVKCVSNLLGQAPLTDDVNECILLHGVRSDLSHVIASDGLDPRVGSTGGMFGVAVYLAENSSKADQYASPTEQKEDDGMCTMILVRAVLGTPYVAASPVPFVKPPCIAAGHAARPCIHTKYDSVLGEIEANTPGATLKRHREFCVYDRAKVYPWAILKYKRV